MISDRDPCFTSHFGTALTKKLGIQQNLSLAFHPQTDRLSERKNQWVEQYLQLVTAMQPEDWEQWLPLASAVHKNRRNTTTGLLPNQILLGYETKLTPVATPTTNNERAEDRIKVMTEQRAQAIEALNKAARLEHVPLAQYNTGDQVWLEATNLCFPLQATKLNPKQYRPFKIIKEISLVTYWLNLLLAWKIHDMFHSSLLLPYQETSTHGPSFTRPPPDLINGEEEFEVECIKGHRRQG